MEARQAREKFAYEWRLDASRVGDVTAARKILASTPPDTRAIAMDPTHHARDVHTRIEEAGARPIMESANYALPRRFGDHL